MLYQFLSILKSSNLGQNYIGGGKAYYFSENRRAGKLSLCDGFLDDGEEFLHIEMKTKIIDEYKEEILPPIKHYILEQAINKEILNTKFIVVVGLYTDSQRASFNFRDSKYLLLYGDSGNYSWSKPRSLEYWRREFIYVRDICSLLTQIKLDSTGSSQIAIPQFKPADLPKDKDDADSTLITKAKHYLAEYGFTLSIVSELLEVKPHILRRELKDFSYNKNKGIRRNTIELLILIGYNEGRRFNFKSLSKLANIEIYTARDYLMSLIQSSFITIHVTDGTKINMSFRRVSQKNISDDQEFSLKLTDKARLFSNTNRFKEVLNANSSQ
jgi:hypothetical protein